MNEKNSIDDMVTKFNNFIDNMIFKFTKITNGLTFLGDKIGNDQKVRKVMRALPPSWEVKATILKELKDKEEMELIGLIGNIKTHEMERETREEKAPQKKKTHAFKSTLIISDEDEEEDDENLSLLVKNEKRMHNKAKFGNRRRW